MDEKKVKRIPYGISDYSLIREENDYYVDKTKYLINIENTGRYLFFIRPRRFGKSLFLSTMKAYYDVYYKDKFEEFFKGTYIYNHPTTERGSYLVLFLNFSEVSSSVDKMEKSFLAVVSSNALEFIERYRGQLSGSKNLDNYRDLILKSNSASDVMGYLNRVVKSAGQKMYVIIDEYDNFANNLLTASGEQAYRDLTHEDGFLRIFFNVLKAGTGDVGAPVTRLFITGVSPVTMDDVTSGFNIGQNITLDNDLNRMLGFTAEDVVEMVEYYRGAGKISHPTEHLMQLMTQWYGNYIFSEDTGVSLFNSNMVLYFLNNYMKQQKPPRNLIDYNVRIDYGKLRHLILIDRGKNDIPGTNGNFSRLKQIIRDGSTVSDIVEGFSINELHRPSNFNSLLFYFGLLTIVSGEGSLYRLKIPNETVKRLYFDYISKAYGETGIFSMDLSKYAILMNDIAFKGEWRPFLNFITGRMQESLSLRDLITGEKAVQTFLNVYLGLSDLFIVHSEKELNNGYADLLMQAHTAKYPELTTSYLLELKYVKAGMTPDDPKLPGLIADAEKQVKNYALDEKFKKTIGSTKLVKLVLIFSGHKTVYIGEG